MRPPRLFFLLVFLFAACAGHLGIVVVENDTAILDASVLATAERVLGKGIVESAEPGLDIHMLADQAGVRELCDMVWVSGCYSRFYGGWIVHPDIVAVWVPADTPIWGTSLVHELVHRFQFDRLSEYGDGHPDRLFGPGGMVEQIEAEMARSGE